MSDESILLIVIIAVIIALGIVAWLLRLCIGLVLVFTAFVNELPFFLVILMFILFPPTLIVYLAGYAYIKFGIAESYYTESDPEGLKITQKDRDAEKERRRALGYDE